MQSKRWREEEIVRKEGVGSEAGEQQKVSSVRLNFTIFRFNMS
jgi:hypothetical protein